VTAKIVTDLAGWTGGTMSDWQLFLVAMMLGGLAVASFLTGRRAGDLDRMGLMASIQTVKQEVALDYERLRLQSMRMAWVALPVEARREYVALYGRPKWAGKCLTDDPLDGVPPVHQVRGRGP
jgi:hypothetical protein